MKVVSDSPTTENKTKENAACQLRARGKSVIRLGVKRSRSDFRDRVTHLHYSASNER